MATGLAVFLVVLPACVTGRGTIARAVPVTSVADFHPAWARLFKGVDCAAPHTGGSEPQAVYAVRIDLAAPGIRFLVTPSNGDRPLDTDGEKTSAFLERHRCQIAVNASFFSPVDDLEGGPRDILGLAASRGDVYSKPDKTHPAVFIGENNKVAFSKPPFDLTGAYNAVSGSPMLLEAGENRGEDDKRHPRTAVGLSRDERYLYLLAIDGRQTGYSVGATTAETAVWIKQLGAYTALNLDGGGSTALVVAGPDGKPRIVNRPIHENVPGRERVNGNSLGVYAAPLEGKRPGAT